MSEIHSEGNMLLERLKYCGMVVLLDLPPGSDFGIDYCSWTVGPKFKGVKMIPPGLHFIHATLPQTPYEFSSKDLDSLGGRDSAFRSSSSQTGLQMEIVGDEHTQDDKGVNEEEGGRQKGNGPTSTQKLNQMKYGMTLGRGSWFYLLPGDVAVLKWNPTTESCTWIRPHRQWVLELATKVMETKNSHAPRVFADAEYILSMLDNPKFTLFYASSREESEEHDRVRRAARRMELDQNLGVYPNDKLEQWTQLVESVGSIVFLECFGLIEDTSSSALDAIKGDVSSNEGKDRRETRFDRLESISKFVKQTQSLRLNNEQKNGSASSNENHQDCILGDLRMVEMPLPYVSKECSPAAVTRLTHDRTVNVLEWLVALSDKYKHVTLSALKLHDAVRQELQLVFTNLLIGQSYGAFETWSRILDALCNSEKLIDHTISAISTNGTADSNTIIPYADSEYFQKSHEKIWSQLKSVDEVDKYLAYLRSVVCSRWDGNPLSQATSFVSLYCIIIETISHQIATQLPTDMFIDALGKHSFLRPSFKSLFQIFNETWLEFESAWLNHQALQRHLSEDASDLLLRFRAQWLRLFTAMKSFEAELAKRPGWKGKSTFIGEKAKTSSDYQFGQESKDDQEEEDGYGNDYENDYDDYDEEDVVIVDEEEAKRYGFI